MKSKLSNVMGRMGFYLVAAMGLAAGSGCFVPAYSGDPVERTEELIYSSESARSRAPSEKPQLTEKKADPSQAKDANLRVLFIGNSYTSNHNLPKIVAELSKAAGRKLEISTALKDGATLAQHADGEAGKKLGDEAFDVVVLQEQSLMPVGAPRQMYESARRLHAAATAKNPRVRAVFFETWARRDRPEDQAKIRRAYQEIAKELKAEMAPAGDAWQAALKADAKRELYAADGSHPTQRGSYLAACVLAATILKRSPVGLDARNVPADEAKRLQEIAAGAIQQAAVVPTKRPE